MLFKSIIMLFFFFSGSLSIEAKEKSGRLSIGGGIHNFMENGIKRCEEMRGGCDASSSGGALVDYKDSSIAYSVEYISEKKIFRLLKPYIGFNGTDKEAYYGYFGFGTKKYIKTPLELKELPEINLFLLSHNHLDHMSQKTINNFPYKNTKVLVPLKLGKYFTRNGYKKDKVKEMDWFDKIKINDEITVTMLPAQHWSKRWIWGDGNTNRSLWGSFLIQYKDKKIFFACDTGPAPFYKELGEKFGPIDLGFGNIGAYNFFPIINVKDKSTAHANPEELLSLMKDLKVKKVVGMHWGTAILSLEPVWEPPVRFKANAEKFGYEKEEAVLFKIGEIKKLDELIN